MGCWVRMQGRHPWVLPLSSDAHPTLPRARGGTRAGRSLLAPASRQAAPGHPSFREAWGSLAPSRGSGPEAECVGGSTVEGARAQGLALPSRSPAGRCTSHPRAKPAHAEEEEGELELQQQQTQS